MHKYTCKIKTFNLIQFVNLELEWRPSHTIMAEFQESAVVCPCTDEKQFPPLQLKIFSDARSGEFELKGVD